MGRRSGKKKKSTAKSKTDTKENLENSEPTEPTHRGVMHRQLPYGKVEGAGVLPADYKPSDAKLEEFCGLTLDYDKDRLIYTTQPPQPIDLKLEDQSDGWVECLLRGEAKRRLFSTPGYPQPILRPPESRHEVKESRHHGLGVFATRDIPFGSLIFSERPLIIVYNALHHSCDDEFFSHSEQMQTQISLARREETLKLLFDRMLKEDQEKYLKLQNSHQFDGSGVITGILRTNGYLLSGFTDMDEEAVRSRNEGTKLIGTYNGVFDQLSRLNHSCCPNTRRNFHVPSLSMRLFAARDIKAGEELFTSYIDNLTSPASERATRLASYDLICACPACTHRSTSDENRAKIAEARNRATLDPSETETSIHLIELLEEEGLHNLLLYPRLLQQVTMSSVLDADLESAMKYGKKRTQFTRFEMEKNLGIDQMVVPGDGLTFCDPDEMRNLPIWGRRRVIEQAMGIVQAKD